MADVRDATWRFINVAPIMAGQNALDDLFAETLHSFGVDRFDCVRFADQAVSAHGDLISDRGLADWKQYFFAQGYHQDDPCPQVCAQFAGAYTWTDVKARMPGQADSAMWSDARAGGMREGLIVPSAPQQLTSPIVRLITAAEGFDPVILPLLQSISVIYASSTQSFFTRSRNDDPEIQLSISLTEREVECLHWAARGKTNHEIGVILDISRHTVNTHVESAKRKLGVATRVQAAAIAHQLGLLSIV
jgi:LuxR family quorum sensing-dependent transcriptional regulator